MTLEELIDSITPEIYARLKKAVELGKWDNGIKLTDAQREQSLQAIIAYDAKRHQMSERVGYIEPKPHTACDESEVAWQTIKVQE